MLGRNKIKYLNSLKIKKYRLKHGQFIAEGDKIVSDILREGDTQIRQLIATRDWLNVHAADLKHLAKEIIETDVTEIERVSSLETSSGVLAVLDLPDPGKIPSIDNLSETWSLALDNIQDPGNLGTIIRTADWFGIGQVFCSPGCADCYNPKVVQASMGALLRVHIHYTELPELFASFAVNPLFQVFGAFTEGVPLYDLEPTKGGLILFGNESRGISDDLFPFIATRITIPPGNVDRPHVESLNVSSSVAIICSFLTRYNFHE